MSKQNFKVGDVFDVGEITITCEVTEACPVYTANAHGMATHGKRISHALSQMADTLSLMGPQDNPIGELTIASSVAHVNPVTGQPLPDDTDAVVASPDELFSQFERASKHAFSALSEIEKGAVEDNQAMLLGAVHGCLRMMVMQKTQSFSNTGDDSEVVLGVTPRMLPIVLDLLRRMRRSDPATVRTYARSFVDDITEMVAHKIEKGAEC